MTLNEALAEIDQAVCEYHTLKLSLVAEQSEILRRLVCGLYYLEKYRIEAHEKYQSIYFNSKATSNAAKDKEADFKTPELYKIRRIMTSSKLIADAVRSTISTNR